MSPVGAHGGNCAIESVAALANSLDRHLLSALIRVLTARRYSLSSNHIRSERGTCAVDCRHCPFYDKAGDQG